MKKIIITGANGFLGRSLIEKISKYYEIYAIVSGRHPVCFSPSVYVVKVDLYDNKCVEEVFANIRPDILIHYAWDVKNDDFESSINNIIWLEISLNLLRCFSIYGGKRILFAGAAAEYGLSNGKWHEMSTHGQLISLYGETKKAFSDIMKNYGSANNVEYVDMRYFSVYGEHDNRFYAAIPMTILSLLNNRPVVCKYPDNVMDYIYIKDAIAVTIKLLESAYCGLVNICSGIPHKMEDVFKIIEKEIDKYGLLSFERDNGCGRIAVGDTSIIEREFGYKCETSFITGIRNTINWMRTVGAGPPPPRAGGVVVLF
jgi:nucleoside-diphosphate-sugar epimerase